MGALSPCLRKIISRPDHFNLRLRPTGLHPWCLIFGVTAACPMVAIWWLAYLARAGLSPAGIIDLARHTPLVSRHPTITTGYRVRNPHVLIGCTSSSRACIC